MKIAEGKRYKVMVSEDFNLLFDKRTGYTETWGKTKEDDPEYCPAGPIIADIEISSVCKEGCKFCYKSNTAAGENMSFETFKDLFHKLPRTLTQIAFGLGDIAENKDLKQIFDYCKENKYQYITPNVTVNGSHMTEEWLDYLAKTCGAVAVSLYDDDNCFNTVKGLTDRGMTQCNIHCLLSEETYEKCMDIIDKVKTDPRLEKLRAVVFLHLKNKGRGEHMNIISDEKYKIFMDKLFVSRINFGSDSCGCSRLLGYGVDKKIEKFITPCESTRESVYINTEGKFYPCSFMEGTPGWEEGVDVTKVKDFVSEVWFHPRVVSWRENLLKNNCKCPVYNI